MATEAFSVTPARRGGLPLLPMSIGIYAATAAVVSPQIYGGMLLTYAQQVMVVPVALLILLPPIVLVMHRRAPLAHMRDLFRRILLRLLAVSVVFCLGIAAFTTFKTAIPSLVPFYADPMLADIDAMLHGGNPGEFAHTLVPAFAEYPLGLLYGPIWFVLWFGLIVFVALREDRALRERYFWSMALTVCVLGTALAIAFSSVGPVLYEPVYHDDRFGMLMNEVGQSAVGSYMQLAAGYLYESYQNGGVHAGSGISAMPSMHLAVATLNAWMLGGINRIAGALGWVYVAVVMVGSVYLGWHYAIDGYLSIAVVSLIWWAAGRVLRGGAVARA